MTRRSYPILGRVELRFLEVNRTALKPVYLRFRILEVGHRTSLRLPGPVSGPRIQDQIQDQIQDP